MLGSTSLGGGLTFQKEELRPSLFQQSSEPRGHPCWKESFCTCLNFIKGDERGMERWGKSVPEGAARVVGLREVVGCASSLRAEGAGLAKLHSEGDTWN